MPDLSAQFKPREHPELDTMEDIREAGTALDLTGYTQTFSDNFAANDLHATRRVLDGHNGCVFFDGMHDQNGFLITSRNCWDAGLCHRPVDRMCRCGRGSDGRRISDLSCLLQWFCLGWRLAVIHFWFQLQMVWC